jgi:hypothetical protein
MQKVATRPRDDDEAHIDEVALRFFEDSDAYPSVEADELEYQELCLTSLTVCCTCD